MTVAHCKCNKHKNIRPEFAQPAMTRIAVHYKKQLSWLKGDNNLGEEGTHQMNI